MKEAIRIRKIKQELRKYPEFNKYSSLIGLFLYIYNIKNKSDEEVIQDIKKMVQELKDKGAKI